MRFNDFLILITVLLSLPLFFLSTFYFLLSTFYFLLSTFHFPLSTFHFPLSTFYFLLSTFFFPPACGLPCFRRRGLPRKKPQRGWDGHVWLPLCPLSTALCLCPGALRA